VHRRHAIKFFQMNKIRKNKRGGGRERYYKSLIPYKHQQNRQHGGNGRRKSSISFSLSAVETHATHERLSQKQSKGLIGFNYNPTVIFICNFFLYFDHFEGYSFKTTGGKINEKQINHVSGKDLMVFICPRPMRDRDQLLLTFLPVVAQREIAFGIIATSHTVHG
jgi:hypothetical protein